MPYCPYCGADNIEGVEECVGCHAPLSDFSLPKPATEVEKALLLDRVDKIALHPAVTATPEEPVGVVMQRMVDRGVGCILLVDNAGKMVGLFSERDALTKINARARKLANEPVQRFATAKPATIEADAKIAFALHKMDIGGYRHLPVLDDEGRPVTVISIRDLLAYLTQRVEEAE